MPKIEVNDINVYYETHGTGFPLVMSIPYSIDWWDPALIDLLSKYFTVVIFDWRGVGKTDDSDLDYLYKTLADDTIGLLDALNIERAHFFGIAGGGCLVQEIALSYPERVEKLVLCSTQCMGRKTVFPSPEVIEIINRTSLAFNSEKQVRIILNYSLSLDRSLLNFPKRFGKFGNIFLIRNILYYEIIIGSVKSF